MQFVYRATNWVRENLFPEENENSYGDGNYYTMFGGPPINYNAAMALVRNEASNAVSILPPIADCKIQKSIVINQESHLLRHTIKIGSKYTKEKIENSMDLDMESEHTTSVISLQPEEQLSFNSKLYFKSHTDLKLKFTFEYIFSDLVRHIQFDLFINPEIKKNAEAGQLVITNAIDNRSWSVEEGIIFDSNRPSIQIEDINAPDVDPNAKDAVFSIESPYVAISPKIIKQLEETQQMNWRLVMKNKDENNPTFPVPLLLVMTSRLNNGDIQREYTKMVLNIKRNKISMTPIDIGNSPTHVSSSPPSSPTSSTHYLVSVDVHPEQTLEQPIQVGDQKKYHVFNFSPLFSGSDEQGRLCAICFEGNADIVTLPCKHVHLCAACANVLRQNSEKCPICRSKIDNFVSLDPTMTPEIFMNPPEEPENEV
mmetsp:Transcript_6293/g.9149  ORF Transcript_6293/g.9149 Transcript_6293/m.9149 type:complete len:426 (-) Transcript_6293:66-1343(-)